MSNLQEKFLLVLIYVVQLGLYCFAHEMIFPGRTWRDLKPFRFGKRLFENKLDSKAKSLFVVGVCIAIEGNLLLLDGLTMDFKFEFAGWSLLVVATSLYLTWVVKNSRTM